MKISIVIPAFNEELLLRETLEHVQAASAAFNHKNWPWELIVCDNNSTDRTADIARAAGAQVVFEAVNQIGRARNCGAAAAKGEWLLFIDADSHPTAELFALVAEQIEVGRCLAGGSIIKLEAGYPVANLFCGLWNAVSRWRKLLAGSFIFCEAVGFRKVGGFSNELFAAEELDLSKRLHELAHALGREIVILCDHPLQTSARKARLYSTWEHLRFVARALARPERVIRDRQACHSWYDGRR